MIRKLHTYIYEQNQLKYIINDMYYNYSQMNSL